MSKAVKQPTWFGYARVSSDDQDLQRQLDVLEACCARTWQETQSTLKEQRERGKVLDYVREGDTLVVTELTRLGRSARDLYEVADRLRSNKVKLAILNNGGPIDLDSPNGKMFFGMLAVVAEFERDMLSERIKSGIAAAKRHAPDGKWKRSRAPKLDAEKVERANALLQAGWPQTRVAKDLGVSRVTLWRALQAS